MQVQERVIGNDMIETQGARRHYTPLSKFSKSDIHFPLTTPRKRAPSVTSIADVLEQDGQSIGRLTIQAGYAPATVFEDIQMRTTCENCENRTVMRKASLDDLPLEVEGKILDFIFGDMHSVNAGSTSLRGKSVASLMRHPRRKAVSDFALVSAQWRELVQERIYRHIKIKGTRAGIQESADFFSDHCHLTRHVRHVEFWVPVWGDKASLITEESIEALRQNRSRQVHYPLAEQADEDLMPASDWLGFTFKLSVQTATLSEIFEHISGFFPNARVLSLEGGHCKKSNMIRQFPKVLFPGSQRYLSKLPNIRTFAMRGAWNIMRQYSDWKTIQAALPNVEEWHCGYAKPRPEADATINEILLRLPSRLRNLNISLDGMYSKDPSTLGSSSLPGYSHPHLCERLGAILPQLESLSFTGKICECMWSSAIRSLSRMKEESRLQALEVVVKSCCRQRVTNIDPETGEAVVDELGGVMADGAGINNLIFIKAFERLVLHTVDALAYFPHVKYIRIRFIDLDSPCTLLNPYWLLQGNRVYGVWSEEIVERLNDVRRETSYDELGDGIEIGGIRKEDTERTVGSLYPRFKPRSIKTSSYRVVAETRGS